MQTATEINRVVVSIWPAVATSAMKVPVTFDQTAAIHKTEVIIQHAVARPLPATHPLKMEANESKRINTTNERTSI